MRPLFILLLSFPLFSLAQDKSLAVEGVSPDLFLSHTVGQRKTYTASGACIISVQKKLPRIITWCSKMA